MCRLFGMVGKTTSPTSTLPERLGAFIELSRIHSDGWGLAWYDGDSLRVEKAPETAFRSETYHATLEAVNSDILINHLRKADPGMPSYVYNSHPFSYEPLGIAFMHNGLIQEKEKIRALIPEAYHTLIQGDTDSETFFWYLVSVAEQDRSRSWEEVLQQVLMTLHDLVPYSSLNCCLLTPDALHMVCDYNPESRQAVQNPGYYEIYYAVTSDAVCVSSSGWEMSSQMQELGNGQILTVERHTLQHLFVMSIVKMYHSRNKRACKHKKNPVSQGFFLSVYLSSRSKVSLLNNPIITASQY